MFAAAAIAAAAVLGRRGRVPVISARRPATDNGTVVGAVAVPPVHVLAAKPAPAGWHQASLAGGGAVLAYPPQMHSVAGDRGTASAAQLTASGSYLMYLNATPKQGAETLRELAGVQAGTPDRR